MQTVVDFTGNACYGGLALVALWGAFTAVLVWRRLRLIRFASEPEQAEFLAKVDEAMAAGDFDAAAQLCEGEERAVAQLVGLAIANRDLGYVKVRSLLVDRFQRDVLADLEHRMNWVNTMIKSAPMLGLYGTVLGMMGGFAQLSTGEKVDPAQLAGNISLALVTTAMGLTIAIPLILCASSINTRIRRFEDLVGYGLTRFLDSFKMAIGETAGAGR
jgi:biopolymer transport protein ExbB